MKSYFSSPLDFEEPKKEFPYTYNFVIGTYWKFYKLNKQKTFNLTFIFRDATPAPYGADTAFNFHQPILSTFITHSKKCTPLASHRTARRQAFA